jgi:DNA-binding transcriptional LysR family regulator
MNTKFVEAFLWSARLGSFRAAGARLHITQAAVASRIANLEQDIGARLFERDPRELRLTLVGSRLLDYGERLLELRREIVSLGRPREDVLGLVRIGAIETVVHTWMVPFLEELRSIYPGIEVQLTSETSRALHRGLREGALDIAFQTNHLADDGIVSTPCLPVAMGWVGPSSTEPHQSVAQLLRQPVLTMSPGSQPHEALKQLYRDAGIPLGKVHCISSISALVRLVSSGFANALVPLAPVYENIQQGQLKVIECDASIPPLRLVISYLGTSGSDAIRLLADLASRISERYSTANPGSFGDLRPRNCPN